MKLSRFGFALLAFGGGLLALAQAGPVHLRFTGGDNLLVFNADDGRVPWNPAGGMLTQLDVFYDAAHPDAANNIWSIRVSSEIGHFTIERPLTNPNIDGGGLSFEYLRSEPGVYEDFEFSALFSVPPDWTGAQPQRQPILAPPGDYGPNNSWELVAGKSMFDVPHMHESFGAGSFTQVIATPEPSTYGILAGVAMLGLAVCRRSRLHPR